MNPGAILFITILFRAAYILPWIGPIELVRSKPVAGPSRDRVWRGHVGQVVDKNGRNGGIIVEILTPPTKELFFRDILG